MGVGVGSGKGVGLAVGVAVGSGVKVGIGVAVDVGVGEGDEVAVGVPVGGTGVTVEVAIGVGVGIGVEVVAILTGGLKAAANSSEVIVGVAEEPLELLPTAKNNPPPNTRPITPARASGHQPGKTNFFRSWTASFFSRDSAAVARGGAMAAALGKVILGTSLTDGTPTGGSTGAGGS